MEETKDFSGTNFGTSKNKGSDFDIDSLIQETLEESQKSNQAEQPPEQTKAFEIKPDQPQAATPVGLPSAPIQKPKEEKAPAPLAPKTEKKDMAGYESTFKEYQAGDIVTGKVVKVDPTGILVDIGYKAEGFISPEEKVATKVGDSIKVLIEQLESKEGYVILSKEKADYENTWREAFNAYKTAKVLEAKVTSAVKGGLVADYNGIRGFIPASHVTKKDEASLEDFVGKTLPIKIIQLNRRQGKVVLSNRLAEPEKHKLEAQKMLQELEVGQVKHGKVTSIKNFGAFVDIGGIEGLIHLSELSWKRVSHPSTVLKIGEELDVFVLGIDKVNRKIALGLKELLPDPWETVSNKYKVGQVIKVKVARLTKFGAFVDIDDQLEGLVHLSELSTTQIRNPEEAAKPGDELEVKILRISADEQKIGLSAKQVIVDREKEEIRQVNASKEEEKKITIADGLATKEKEKAEKESKQEYELVEAETMEQAPGEQPEQNA